jgi:hypothetical protein
MPSTASPLTHDNVAEFWRRRFRRQRHVNAGVRSLLQKYGTASSAAAVSSDFLLTLMGNLVASEACFYRTSDDDCALVPRAAFGSNTPDELPRIALDNAFGQILAQGGPPQLLNALPRSVTDGDALGPITGRYKLFAPLYFEDHLGGVVFLGPKVSGAAFTDNDMELVEALCAVTAAVLRYKDWRQAASGFADRNAMMLNRCRERAALPTTSSTCFRPSTRWP